jgi:hypothetical protein
VGLFYDNDAPSHRMGAVFGVLGTAAFCATGIFPEPTGIVHLTAVFASTLLISAAMLLIGGANLDGAHKRAGGLSVALAIIALAGLSLFSYERGVAVVITFAAISVWAFAFGVRRRTHHNKFKNEKRRNIEACLNSERTDLDGSLRLIRPLCLPRETIRRFTCGLNRKKEKEAETLPSCLRTITASLLPSQLFALL